MIPRGLLILGFGGHARSVADVALDAGIAALAFVDEAVRPGEHFLGFPVHARMPEGLAEGWFAFPGAGDSAERRRQIERAEADGFAIGCLVSPRAYVGRGAAVAPGSFIAHHAHIGPMATIGHGAIINTAAVVDHESWIGDLSHVSVNATIAGRCTIGRSVFVGAGATVIDRVSIADGVVVGAGSTVVEDIVEPGTYAGCPARRLAAGKA